MVREFASRLGFEHCGIAKAVKLDEDARRLESWLHKGMHGSMKYMENHFEMRVDPSKLVPGARSVITLLLNYFPAVPGEEPTASDAAEGSFVANFSSSPQTLSSAVSRSSSDAPGNTGYKIARYAYGQDYHEVIRAKLNEFLFLLREKIGEVNGRGFVDSAPVLERAWALRSGAGWIGKNGNLITKDGGSYFFIATLITDLELAYDDPFAGDYCGTCTRCIDACPTEAIGDNKVVDGSRCISYYTIELKEMLIPSEVEGKFDGWMFGCDVCQEVCPWNRFAKPTKEVGFTPLPGVLNFSTSDWEGLTEDSFRELFKHSPLRRAKLKGIQRNLRFLQGGDGN